MLTVFQDFPISNVSNQLAGGGGAASETTHVFHEWFLETTLQYTH